MEFHEIANIFPLMQGKEFAELVEDVRKQGRLELPIWLYEGKILDGRNRYRACMETGIYPRYEEYTGDSPVQFVISLNKVRRHLTASQLAMAALRLLPYYEEEAKKRQGTRTDLTLVQNCTNVNPNDTKATEQAGKALGVSGRYVAYAKQVAKDASLAAKVDSGEVTLDKAYAAIQLLERKEARSMQQSNGAIVPYVSLMSYDVWLAKQGMCDLLLTDPPYMTDVEDIATFAQIWLPQALSHVKPTGRAYVFIGAYPEELRVYLNVQVPGWNVEQVLAWVYKNTHGTTAKHTYKQNWQAILYYIGKDAPPLNAWVGDEAEEWYAAKTINAPDSRSGVRDHAWQKPNQLAEEIVLRGSQEGDVVFDCFVGTGTFLVAAAKYGRYAFGCDNSPEMLEIAKERGCIHDGNGEMETILRRVGV